MTARRTVVSIAVASFQRERSGHIAVVACLAGKTLRLMVHTGAGATSIDAGLLGKYKLALAAKSKKGGGVGTSTMTLATVASHDLSLQGLDLASFKLIALDLSHVVAGLSAAKVEPIAGVLGADVLRRRRAVIDYARDVMLLSQ